LNRQRSGFIDFVKHIVDRSLSENVERHPVLKRIDSDSKIRSPCQIECASNYPLWHGAQVAHVGINDKVATDINRSGEWWAADSHGCLEANA